jgi:hypothetical protein
MIFSTIPGMVALGFSGIRSISRFIKADALRDPIVLDGTQLPAGQAL